MRLTQRTTLVSSLITAIVAVTLSTGCQEAGPAQNPSGAASITPADARSIAKDAYIYGVPMVAQYKTMYAFSIDKNNPQYKGPFDSILNIARVFTPADTAFVTPNSDTPYSFAGLDLRAEPTVITIPKMEKNRYFVFQLMDLYTFNFAYIGSRTTGNDGGTYLIAGPELEGRSAAGTSRRPSMPRRSSSPSSAAHSSSIPPTCRT